MSATIRSDALPSRPHQLSRSPLRVGVLGAGVVGRAVIEGLTDHPERLATADGRQLCLAAVAVRDLAKASDGGIDSSLLTDAPAHLVADPGVDIVVELMGGIEPARTLILAALGAGKPVVTANKAVVAQHGPALEAAARNGRASLRFEAAVGGGIPVLGPLADDLAGNEVTRVRGIVNGTTNYILSAMAHDGRPYDEVLRDAQELGYAEADPSGDVEGDDAVNKLVILARLAFGAWLDPATVGRRPPTTRGAGEPGITGVTEAELRAADGVGLRIKLLATARRTDDGIEAGVVPTALPGEGPFARTDGVTNRVEIDAVPLGTVGLSGPGAGGAATSSAVLGDLVAIARGGGSTWAGLAPARGPAAALDPFDGPRAWFAVGPDGKPIRTDVLPLAEAKQAVAREMAGGQATLYPIDG